MKNSRGGRRLNEIQTGQDRLYAGYESGAIELEKHSERSRELGEMKDAVQTERQNIRENTGNRTVALENPDAVIRYAGAPRRFLEELESFVKTHVAADAMV